MVARRDQTNHTRCPFVTIGACALFAVILLFCWTARTTGNERPNVLLVLSDQEREDVPRSVLRLPNRQSLEQHGIRFTNAFCTTPQCSPSRVSFLTGLYPHQAGVVTNVDKNSLGQPLSPNIPSLGKVFLEHGYSTAYLGKWHLGNDEKGLDAFGFSNYKALREPELTAAAAQWIKKQPSRPWLLVVSFINPHDIYGFHPDKKLRPGISLPENFEDKLRLKPSPQMEFLTKDQGKPSLKWGKEEWLRYRSYYLDLIEKVDSHLGLILDTVKAKGETENTIVVYTSDHGDMGGAHRLPFKGPFMYEELLKVPFLISYPRRFRTPAVSHSLVSLVDLVPTLCGLAGVQWPGALSGKNLATLFDHPTREIHEAVFSEYYGKQKWVNPIRTIRTREWKYNLYIDTGKELYDLRNDPGELHNVANHPRYSDIQKQLAESLQQWRRQTRDPLLTTEPRASASGNR